MWEFSEVKYLVAKYEIIINIGSTRDIIPLHCQDAVLGFATFVIYLLKGQQLDRFSGSLSFYLI